MTTSAACQPHHDLNAVARDIGFAQCVQAVRRVLVTTPLGWLLVAWFAWPRAPHANVLAWVGGFCCSWLAGLRLLRGLRGDGLTLARHARQLLAVVVLDGVAWGAVVWLLLGFDRTLDFWIGAVLCGVAAVNAPIYITWYAAYATLMGSLWATAMLAALCRTGLEIAGEVMFGLTIWPAHLSHALHRAAHPGRHRPAVAQRIARRAAEPGAAPRASGSRDRRAHRPAQPARARRPADPAAGARAAARPGVQRADAGHRPLQAHQRHPRPRRRRRHAARLRAPGARAPAPGRHLRPLRRRGIRRRAARHRPRGGSRSGRAAAAWGGRAAAAQRAADPHQRLPRRRRHLAGETAEQLLERADTAVYAAKRGGRNRVQTAEETVPA